MIKTWFVTCQHATSCRRSCLSTYKVTVTSGHFYMGSAITVTFVVSPLSRDCPYLGCLGGLYHSLIKPSMFP